MAKLVPVVWCHAKHHGHAPLHAAVDALRSYGHEQKQTSEARL